ncbi:hypothetical protein [Lactococcus lactis]
MNTNGLKTNQDLFTEHEVDFEKTLGKLYFLSSETVPEFQSVVVDSETGSLISSALVDESGQVIDGTLPEGVNAEVRERPVEGTMAAQNLILESEVAGGQIEITVPNTVKVNSLTYNQEIKLQGMTARHWTRTTRRMFNNNVSYSHQNGFKLRAESILPVKVVKDKSEK